MRILIGVPDMKNLLLSVVDLDASDSILSCSILPLSEMITYNLGTRYARHIL
jgi:hypothetical protein